jgi:hypothetical protein
MKMPSPSLGEEGGLRHKLDMLTRRTFIKTLGASGTLALANADVSDAGGLGDEVRIWDQHAHLGSVSGATPEERMGFLVKCMDRVGVERAVCWARNARLLWNQIRPRVSGCQNGVKKETVSRKGTKYAKDAKKTPEIDFAFLSDLAALRELFVLLPVLRLPKVQARSASLRRGGRS